MNTIAIDSNIYKGAESYAKLHNISVTTAIEKAISLFLQKVQPKQKLLETAEFNDALSYVKTLKAKGGKPIPADENSLDALVDKTLSDLVYNFLLFNGVPAKEIIYSNCDDSVSRIPEDVPIFDYLRDFFVNSYSDQKIYVIFITSEHIKGSFGTMAEIGAAWITKADHKIINVSNFRPEKPLNDTVTWQTSIVDEDGNVSMTKLNADLFCAKIENLCAKLGYTPKDRETNMTRLISSIKIV